MDIYILGEDLRPNAIIDNYESFIWTERYNAYGDFELLIKDSPSIRNTFKKGSLFTIAESDRVMMVETVLKSNVDSEAGLVSAGLKITGRSAEAMLEERLALLDLAALEQRPEWIMTESPRHILRDLVVYTAGQTSEGGLRAKDAIYGFRAALPSNLPVRTIPLPPGPVTIKIEPESTYSQVKKICDMYELGFVLGLHQSPTDSYFYFDVYTGTDRSSKQTLVDPIVFSPEFENLTNTKELTSIASLKNVAYVLGRYGSAIVIANDLSEPEGLERRVLLVQANDIELAADDPNLPLALKARGWEELAKHQSTWTFDGEITQNSGLVYGRDYFLGDLVEQRDNEGISSIMRVTEQIFAKDSNGMRTYPTLSTDLLITPGTWQAWPPAQEWPDAPGTWSEA